MSRSDVAGELPLNLHEYEAEFRSRTDRMVSDFVAGGTGDERTVRANREAFDGWRLIPRVLSGLAEVSTECSVLGQTVASPVLVAPTSLHRLVHEDGERATARAARTAGTIYAMSSVASILVEDIAPDAGPWWFQLYVFADRGFTRELVQRAESSGATALLITVDTPVLGRREADDRNHFALPSGVTMANLTPPESTDGSGVGSRLTRYASPVESALSWKDLDWLASLSTLPVVPKGILHPIDAIQAVECGARAVVVSNHGGRQLDGAIATLDALPAVVAAVDGRAEVLVDGGVRRGIDILIALALGAKAVLIGRPIYWGLAHGGEAGVHHVLELLRSELARDLLLCGIANPAEVTRSLITRANLPMLETLQFN